MNWKRLFCWSGLYLLVIVVFSFLYHLLPSSEWGGDEKMTRVTDALYFSVVTITSLGYGDIYPVAGSFSRLLVSLEAISGILVIGFFLNNIALSQTKFYDRRNREKEEKKRKDAAVEKLELYTQELKPVFERYLRGVYEVITPLDRRMYPEDFLHHDYSFLFKDLHELYGHSLMMNNEFSEPVVSIYFRNQDVLYQELKEFVTYADLSYWSDLEVTLFHFIQSHHTFQFKEVILNNGQRCIGKDQKLQDMLSKIILETDGEPEYRPSNVINAYVSFYYFLKDNISTVQKIWEVLERESNKNDRFVYKAANG